MAPPSPAPTARTIAVQSGEGSVALWTITGDRVVPGATLEDVTMDFGWLDPRILVSLGTTSDDQLAVRRWVEGTRIDDLVVPRATWPAHAPELRLVGADQVWLAGCLDSVDDDGCKRPTYVRVSPGPLTVSETGPGPSARTVSASVPFPLPPDAPAPAGARASVERDPTQAKRSTVTCERGAERTSQSLAEIFADPREIDAWDLGQPDVRWVATTPPAYEVRFDATNPVGGAYRLYRYWRPCDLRPLADLAWLGPDLWAELSDEDALWTVHRGPRTIGTVAGVMIR